MNKRAFLVVPVIAILAMLPSYGFTASKDQAGTQPAGISGESVDRPCHRHSLHAIMEKPGITEAQKGKIRALYAAFRDNTRRARTELISTVDEKKTMLLSGKADQQKLAKLDDQAVGFIGEILGARLKLRRDRLGLLTPEQMGRMADWQAEKAFQSRMKRISREGGDCRCRRD